MKPDKQLINLWVADTNLLLTVWKVEVVSLVCLAETNKNSIRWWDIHLVYFIWALHVEGGFWEGVF